MARIYLDSSAYIKEFSREKGSEPVEKIFEAYSEGKIDIATSQWTIGESVAAIDRKKRRGEITDEEMRDCMASVLGRSYELAQNEKFNIVPVRPELVTASLKYVTIHHISADDALQLFSAIVSLCEIFVAADVHLVNAAKKEGFESYNIETTEDAETLLQKILSQ